MSYPSHITNIYELLDQDGEAPSTVKAVAPAKNTTPAKSAPAKGTSSAPAKSTQQSSAPRDNQRRGDRQQGERQQGEGRGGFRQDNRAPRQQRGEGGFNAPREGGFNAPREGGFNAPRTGGNEGESERQPVEFARRDRDPRDTSESRGDSRRRGAPAGGFVGNRRFNDRKSGSGSRGRPGEEKRGGRGRGNWGANDGSDVVVDENGEEKEGGVAAEGAETSVTSDKPEEPHVETEEEKAKREDREKDAKMMTLDDYKKQQEAKRQASSLAAKSLEVRKANEGVDPNQAKKWSSLQQIKRDDEDEKKTAPSSTEEKKKEEKKGGKNTVRLDEIFQVKEAPRPRYEDSEDRRGGRGGGRGGRGGRGGSRGSSQRTERAPRTQSQGQNQGSGAQVADFSDPNSFPTLQ